MTQPNRVPWMHSITLTTHSQAYNLYTLCAAITPSLSKFAQSVQLQVDITAGSAKVYVGSPDSVAANDCGAVLVATQAATTIGYTSDMLKLEDIELMSDTDATLVNVIIICR